MDRRQLLFGDRSRSDGNRLVEPDLAERLLGGERGRRAADDAVEVLREALCRRQRLAAAGRAAVEVGKLRRPRRRTRPRPAWPPRWSRGWRDRRSPPARRRSRTCWRPGRCGPCPCWRSRSRRRGVGHRRIADRAGEAAVAHHLQLAVPSGGRHPHLGLDVGLRCRLQRHGHAAERAQAAVWVGRRCAAAPGPRRRREGARSHLVRGRHRALRDAQRRQAVTRAGIRRRGG